MTSEILEQSLKEFDKIMNKEFCLGLKVVQFDENGEELEPEFRKISSFPLIEDSPSS